MREAWRSFPFVTYRDIQFGAAFWSIDGGVGVKKTPSSSSINRNLPFKTFCGSDGNIVGNQYVLGMIFQTNSMTSVVSLESRLLGKSSFTVVNDSHKVSLVAEIVQF